MQLIICQIHKNASFDATILDVVLTLVMLVDETLTIVPELSYTRYPLTMNQSHQVLSDCRKLMKSKYGIMYHVTDIFVVRQNRNNYVNVRIKRDYVNTVYISTSNSLSASFCFIASDKLESVIILVVIDHNVGRLHVLPNNLLPFLEIAVNEFCLWTETLQLSDLRFTYTNQQQRQKCRDMQQKFHSAHFHLKIHIDKILYKKLFPAFCFIEISSRLDTTNTFESIDQFQYVNMIQKFNWSTVKKMIYDQELQLSNSNKSGDTSSNLVEFETNPTKKKRNSTNIPD